MQKKNNFFRRFFDFFNFSSAYIKRKLIRATFIIIIFLLELISSCAAAAPLQQQQFIAGWMLQFWKTQRPSEIYNSFVQGDSLQISFLQQLTPVPISRQPQYSLPDTTGVCDSLFVSYDTVAATEQNDSTAAIIFSEKLSLLPGFYTLIIYTISTTQLRSRNSKQYFLQIINYPPALPVEIHLFLVPRKP